MGFLLRFAFAFALLAATYNPTAWNFVDWARGAWGAQTSFVVLAGLVLLSAYVVFLTAVMRGIGSIGVVLLAAVFGALVWVLYDLGWIDLDDPTAVTWIALIGLSLVLAAGMYWGILWRRISGQVEVDDENA